MGKVYMSSKDTIIGSQAECYVEIDNKLYNLFNVIKFEAKIKKNKTKVPILGKISGGNRSTGCDYTGTMTLHYNMSIFRKLMEKYKDELEDAYFNMYVTNEDKTSNAGRQTVSLFGCNLDEMTLASFDASSSDILQEDVSFTYEDYKLSEEFKLLNGLLV